MAAVTVPSYLHEYALELPVRIRKFIWLFAGMFSMGSLALAFLGYTWAGNLEQSSTNFLASVVSGFGFWLLCRQKFGPVEA